MRPMVTVVVIVLVVSSVAVVAVLLDRAGVVPGSPVVVDPNVPPIESVLMRPSAEWDAAYANVPAEQRRLYWTVRTLTQVAVNQQKRIQALEDPNTM